MDITDELLAQAKTFARERGVTLRELIESGLRRELKERAEPPAKRFAWLHKPYGDPQGTWPRPPFDEDDWAPIREACYERDEGE